MHPRPNPLKVAVLCSQRAPGVVHLLNRDARRGTDYDVVCCVTSSDTFAEEVRVERRGVPCVPHPIRTFCRERDVQLTDLAARVDYDRETLELLKPFAPDVIVLAGYLLLLTAPVLERFEGRILNVHHSDLTIRDAIGQPRYRGLRAVRDAVLQGETQTRATAHVVTPRVDDGPIILRSWAFDVPVVARWALESASSDVLRAYAWAHQEWMLRTAWGPMLAHSIELASIGYTGPRAPLDVEAIGQWTLSSDGIASPDEVPAYA